MPAFDNSLSGQINEYLNKIIAEDETFGVTEVYTELSAREISPITLRLDNVGENKQQVFEIFEFVEKEKNLVISGVSGSGKTTTLKWLNVTLSKKYLKNEDRNVPIYVELNSYIRGTFFDYIKIKVKEKGLSEQVLKSLLNEKAILLIDGLDLLSPADNFAPYDEILNFVSEYSGCRYVISSRPGFFESFKSRFKISELEELADDKICSFIEKYAKDTRLSESLKYKILSDKKLTSIFRNPMMLYLATKVAVARKDGKDEVLPSNRPKMYEEFISDLFSHYLKKNKTLRADRIQIEETLTDIYFKLQCKNRVSCKYQHALDAASKHAEDERFNKTAAQNILYDIFKLGLLSRDDVYIQYGIHQSIQEYFAAIKLKKCFENDIDISEAFRQPKWEDVVIFASEMFECPNDLIKSMIASGDLHIASKCAKNASREIKEELCLLLADKLDSRFELEKTNAIVSIGRLGDIGTSIITEVYHSLGQLEDAVRDIGISIINELPRVVNFKIQISAAYTLSIIESEKAIKLLINDLNGENYNWRRNAIYALGKIRSEEAVGLLINALNSEDDMVRWGAAEALSEIKSDKAVEPLIKLLEDENINSQNSAAYALGEIGSDKAVEPLIKALKDENRDVRSNAAYVLSKIKSDKAVRLLINALEDENDDVRSIATYALGKIGSDRDVVLLINALSDKNDAVRMNAAYALGEIGSDKAVEPLIKALKDEKGSVRERVAYALGKIKSDRSVEPLISLLKDEDDNVRRSATNALGKISSEKAVEPLIKLLKDEKDDVRRSATYILGEISSEKAVEPLIKLLKDENEIVRSNAVYILFKIKSNRATEQLINALRDENENVRRGAAYAHSKIKSDRAVEPLINALSDENENVRTSVAYALGEIRSDKAVEPLVKALKDEKDEVRKSVAEALEKICSDKAVEPLVNALSDENFDVQCKAADALVKIGSNKTVELLLNAAKDENDFLRWNATLVLSRIKSEKAVEPLIKMLQEKNYIIRRNAIVALSELSSDKAVEPLINALHDENDYVQGEAAEALKKICTVKHKEILKPLLESENELAANTSFEILSEIEQVEKSKMELFQKPVISEKPKAVSSKNREVTFVHPPEEGFIDAYFGIFIDRLKSIAKPKYIVDYGCGQGKLLCAMKSLPESALKNISYIGVDIKTSCRFKARLTAEKYGLIKSLIREPEFLKPEDFFAKNIPVDYVFIMHALHEIKLVDLIEVIYSISTKLKKGGSIFILDQRKLAEKERKFVLWDDKRDFEALFLDSGFEQYTRFFSTKSGNQLSLIEAVKINDHCFPKDKIAKNCLEVYKSKRKKLLKERDKSGISDIEFQELSVHYTNISAQIEECNRNYFD